MTDLHSKLTGHENCEEEVARLRSERERTRAWLDRVVAENARLREALLAQVEYDNRNGPCWCGESYADSGTDNEHAEYCLLARAALGEEKS